MIVYDADSSLSGLELSSIPQISAATAKASAKCNVLSADQLAEIRSVTEMIRALKDRKLRARQCSVLPLSARAIAPAVDATIFGR